MPHMHLRGKDFEYRLVLPDGTSKIVLNVPRYDFNWQLNYWVKEPIAAPKGSARKRCASTPVKQQVQSRPDQGHPMGSADPGRDDDRLVDHG
jgi:hypothetical protein